MGLDLDLLGHVPDAFESGDFCIWRDGVLALAVGNFLVLIRHLG